MEVGDGPSDVHLFLIKFLKAMDLDHWLGSYLQLIGLKQGSFSI